MELTKIRELLEKIPHGKIAVIGDFCVDVYWDLKPDDGEISLETGVKTTPVSSARYAPGGAGNIVANLRGMGLQKIPCSGAFGNDPFGLWLADELLRDSSEYASLFLKVSRKEYHTPVYCKPLLDSREQSRFDLGNTPLTDEEVFEIINRLESIVSRLEVIIINEQLSNGLHSECFRRNFAEFVKQHEGKVRFVFDGRANLDAYPGVILKINAGAASRLAFGKEGFPPEASGKKILNDSGNEFIITDGEKGAYVFEQEKTTFIPAIRYNGPIDTVGAGDSFTAGFAWALACGASMVEAAQLGTCCSAVTVRKINQTGVPYPREILDLF